MNVRRLLELLPGARMDCLSEVVQVTTEPDTGIVVLVTAEAFELRLPTVEWTAGTHGPERASRFYRRLRADRADDEALAKVLAEAEAKRRSEYRPCRFCGDLFPPEHRHGSVCHGCAESHLGVVH